MLSYNASNVGMQAETCVLVAPAGLKMTWPNFDIARGVSLTRSVLNAHYLLRQCSMSPSAGRVTSLRFGVENMSLWKVGRAGCVQHISEHCLRGANFALSGMMPTNSCGGRARVLIAAATSALARNAASMSQTTR